jgi:hypothetical protein
VGMIVAMQARSLSRAQSLTAPLQSFSGRQ